MDSLYPRNNEELQQFKKFSDDIRTYIVDELTEYSFPLSKFDNDIKRKVKILNDKTLTAIFGRGEAMSPKILLLAKFDLIGLVN